MPTKEAQDARNRRVRLALVVASIAIALSMLTAGLAFVQRFNAQVQARANNRLVWHAVICEIEHAVYHARGMKPVQKRRALKFYNTLLVKDVQAKPCTRAEILGPSKALIRR